MRHLINLKKTGILALLLLNATCSNSQTLDQFDTSYNAGLSARTLPGYSWFQTFTAGITGSLTRIDIGFFNYISGSGTLEVYEDTGITGNIIFSNQVNVSCPGNGCLIPFQVNCNVVTGNSYTFRFIPGIGIPDPFGVQQDYLNNYSGGEMYGVDPSGTYPFNMDLIFATYVKTETTGLQDDLTDRSSLYKIVNKSVVLNNNITGKLYSVIGHQVTMVDVQPGVYILNLNSPDKNYNFKIYIK